MGHVDFKEKLLGWVICFTKNFVLSVLEFQHGVGMALLVTTTGKFIL